MSLSPVHARPEGLRGHGVDYAEVWGGRVGGGFVVSQN